MRRIILATIFVGLIIVFSIALSKYLFPNTTSNSNCVLTTITSIIYMNLGNKSIISVVDYNSTKIPVVLNPKDLYIKPFIASKIVILEIAIASARKNDNDVSGITLYISLQSINGSIIHLIPKPIKIDADKVIYQVPLVQGIGSLVVLNNDINEKRLLISLTSKKLY